MSNQTEDLLRAGMERFTSDVAVPSGLAARAAAHRQRRRQVTAAAASGGALAIVVASALTVAARTPVTGDARTTAYVISRTEAALAAVSQRTFIQSVHETISGKLPGWPAGAQPDGVTLWSYREQTRIVNYGPGGRLLSDDGEQEIGGQRVFITVDYRARTWWRNSMTSPWVSPTPEDGCAFASGIEGLGNIENHDWVTEIRTALSCGLYTVAGTERVDGVPAIKLTPVHPPQTPYGTMTTVFWVDPATYLPVHDRTTLGTAVTRDDFRWLPPTAANLHNLQVPIPPGFTRARPR